MQPSGPDPSLAPAKKAPTPSFSIHISNLKEGTTDKALREFIAAQKISIKSCVVPDNKQGSLFAKASFYVEAEAERAIAVLNGANFEGKVLHVTRDRRKEDLVKEANLFVKEIPFTATEAELRDKFKGFGSIVSVKLATFQDGKSRGFGYVQFESAEEAKQAIESMDGQEWEGKTMKVTVFQSAKDRENSGVIHAQNNLYVKGFKEDMTEDRLKETFSQHGEVTSISIPDASKRFGYVCFKTEEQALAAITALDGKANDGDEPWTVTKHLRKHELTTNPKHVSTMTSNLFLTGIPEDLTEARLGAVFGKFGKVTSISIRSEKGIAYVCFEAAKDASTAIYECTLRNPFPESSSFKVDYFIPKDVREKQREEAQNSTYQATLFNEMMTTMTQMMSNMGYGMPHQGYGGRGRGRGGYPRGRPMPRGRGRGGYP